MKRNTPIAATLPNESKCRLIRRTLALCTLIFVAAIGSTQAVPISISFDNPNPSVAAPPSGSTTVFITGTIMIDPSFQHIGVAYFSPTNITHTLSLTINTSVAFNLWFANNPSGTFSGTILEISVPAGTPSDFYGYEVNANNLATFGIGVAPLVGGSPTSAEQAYSVTVTNGSAVPDNDVTLLLLGLTGAILFFARRAFVLKAWPTTG